MKIYAIFGSHPLYQELLNHPPHGITYVNKQDITTKKYYGMKKNILKKVASKIGVPRIMKIKTDAKLIHSSRGIIPFSEQPYVMDLEAPYSLTNLNFSSLRSSYWKNLIKIMLKSPRCKKLMLHCDASETEMLIHFPGLRDKVEVLYPASSVYNFKRKVFDKKFRILFVSGWKEVKGGLFLEKAVEELKKEGYEDIELIMHTDYHKYPEKIMPREEILKKYFVEADLYCYPSMLDTFGYSLLDAMSVEVPILTTDIYAIPEIVEHMKTGYVIHSPTDWTDWAGESWKKHIPKPDKCPEFVQELKKGIKWMIDNPHKRRQLAHNGWLQVKKGKFSIANRNRKLLEIYKEALE